MGSKIIQTYISFCLRLAQKTCWVFINFPTYYVIKYICDQKFTPNSEMQKTVFPDKPKNTQLNWGCGLGKSCEFTRFQKHKYISWFFESKWSFNNLKRQTSQSRLGIKSNCHGRSMNHPIVWNNQNISNTLNARICPKHVTNIDPKLAIDKQNSIHCFPPSF